MITERAKKIRPFIVMDVLERAQALEKQGEHIIHLEVGEPDFETPACIRVAGERALQEGKTHYTHSQGLLLLREAICEHYQKRYGIRITPEQIIVTSGTSPAMLLIFGALLEAGDETIISDPHYACYPNFIRFVGGKPVTVPVDEKDGFQFRPDDIRQKMTSRTRAVFINSPANPTGNLLAPDRMAEIADLGSMVVSDEIYHGLVYEGKEHSILEYTDNCFVLNGFSKLYAMTGWRLGYVIAPHRFVRPMQKMQQNFFISASAMAQWAGVEALRAEEAEREVARMVSTYDQRRRYMIQRLKGMGFGIEVEPTGAFYVLANAKRFSTDSYRLAFDILHNAKVGVTPGIDFGENAEGYLRFTYANSLENIAEGMDRLESYLKSRPSASPD
ncbi:MAG: pyridoxal phosphate-dependent aminotransferase [Deltaproteobacteria bacterium]|nr:MAG: pyridoxal phosphate-dependent aminotransferase [Deltaproteobacteria bacterium]